jgi:hypothetical protein
MNSQQSPTISSFVPTTEYRPTPGQLAAALARLEGEKYRQILPAEYVAHAGGLPLYSPNLSAAIALNELIGKWIKSSILDERLGEGKKGLQERSKVMQFFVETAKVRCAFQIRSGWPPIPAYRNVKQYVPSRRYALLWMLYGLGPLLA